MGAGNQVVEGIIIISIIIIIIVIIIRVKQDFPTLNSYRCFINCLYFILFFLNSWKKLLNFRGWQFFLLKWNVFNSNKFFLVKLTLSKLN